MSESFMKYNEVYGFEVPTIQAVWYYLLYLTPSTLLYNLSCFFLHWLPAYFIDGISILIGKKPILRKAYKKIEKFSAVIGYFAVREWKFKNKNIQGLFKELCDADKHIFNFDISSIEWSEYFKSYVRGVRVYLLKDPLETIPQGMRKYSKLKIIHYLAITIVVSALLRIQWFIVRLVLG